MASPADQPAGGSPAATGGGVEPRAGLPMPRMMYGTAWKKEQTTELVYQAIRAGFRGVDTAAMGKHYREDLVGEGIRKAIGEGIVRRRDLYIQTKFTPTDSRQGALDSQVPYDPDAPLAAQLRQSVELSLHNLATRDEQGEPYLDCVLLHSPLQDAPTTRTAWLALEELVPHKVRSLGISNVDADLLWKLWPVSGASRQEEEEDQKDTTGRRALRLPAVVQNRFHRREYHWHLPVREFCRARGIAFQAFWILTANGKLWQGPPGGGGPVDQVARGAGISPAAALYALVLATDLAVLDGTTNAERMAADLAAVDQVAAWRQTEDGKEAFDRCVAAFQEIVGAPA